MLQAEREKLMTTQTAIDAYPVRIRFARSGAIAFIGHLDLMRAFERSLRRAQIPVLYSQGYNPRPVLVFALPLGVGISTTDDYVDVSLCEQTDLRELITRFNAHCPPGLRALGAKEIGGSKKSIMSLVSAATYRITAEGIPEAVENLMLRDRIIVSKHAKGREKETDIRPLILEVTRPKEAPDAVDILTRAGSAENLRPDLLLSACVRLEKINQRTADNAEVLRTGLFAGEYLELIRLGDLS
ncbi:MAG: DUF2344 domain-containing protein [Clostridiales bacterium]|nr:DUF2344 domain-containing protein [Clostridiales bacterium]